MPPEPRSDGQPSGTGRGLTVAAVAAAVVCCAAPLLVAAGLVASVGVLLRNLALVGAGLLLVGWPVARAVNRLRQSNHQIDPSQLHQPIGGSDDDEPRCR